MLRCFAAGSQGLGPKNTLTLRALEGRSPTPGTAGPGSTVSGRHRTHLGEAHAGAGEKCGPPHLSVGASVPVKQLKETSGDGQAPLGVSLLCPEDLSVSHRSPAGAVSLTLALSCLLDVN